MNKTNFFKVLACDEHVSPTKGCDKCFDKLMDVMNRQTPVTPVDYEAE